MWKWFLHWVVFKIQWKRLWVILLMNLIDCGKVPRWAILGLSGSLFIVFSGKFCVTVFSESEHAIVFKRGIHMDNEWLCYGIKTQTHCSYFLSFFLFVPFLHFNIANLCYSFFSGTAEVRHFIYGILINMNCFISIIKHDYLFSFLFFHIKNDAN